MSAVSSTHLAHDAQGRRPGLPAAELARRVHHWVSDAATSTVAQLAAVRRSFDDLERVLSDVVGKNGHRAMFSRCVHKASVHHGFLRELRFRAGGVDVDTLLPCLAQQPSDVIAETAVTLLTCVFELLSALIGHDLTFGIFRDTWPAALGDASGEKPGAPTCGR